MTFLSILPSFLLLLLLQLSRVMSSIPSSVRPRVIIVPGCGCYPVRDANWYEWFEQKLLTQQWRFI